MQQQQHGGIVFFEGENVKGRHCIVFKMLADANDPACGFCNKSYADYDGNGRWDTFQCWDTSAPPQCVDADHFLVCSDCRTKEAAFWINENNNAPMRIFLENASNTTLYCVDSYFGYDY